MRARSHIWSGVVLGFAAALGVLSFYDGAGKSSTGWVPGPLLSECDGALHQLVIHYTEEAAEVVVPTYRDFFSKLSPGVTVYALCPNQGAFDDLVFRVGPTPCELQPVIADHPITAWSRDRWLAFGPGKDQGMELVCSREEEGADVWPPRQGDQKVAEDLARVLGPNVLCRRSDLFFDGGDFAADGETVFVRPAVVIRNLQRTVATREELIENLENWLGRRVVLLEGAPDHHVAMYMMPVGNKTVLVGDPRMAQHLLAESPESRAVATFFPGGPDFTETAVARFEAVADHCRSAGYQVVRIPLVPGNDGRTFLTYVNALIEQRAGRRIVYLPVYPFAETLNRAAASIWANLGYEVRTVQCDTCACHFGTLHCLVNVLRRQ